MSERIDEIRNDIQNLLYEGYEISELNKIHRADVEGFILAISEAESAFDNLPCFMDNSLKGQIEQEEAQKIWEHVYEFLIHKGCELVDSIIDGNEEYWEPDPDDDEVEP